MKNFICFLLDKSVFFSLIQPCIFKITLWALFMAMVIMTGILISQGIPHLILFTIPSLQIISFEFPDHRLLLPWSKPLLIVFWTSDSYFVRVIWVLGPQASFITIPMLQLFTAFLSPECILDAPASNLCLSHSFSFCVFVSSPFSLQLSMQILSQV